MVFLLSPLAGFFFANTCNVVFIVALEKEEVAASGVTSKRLCLKVSLSVRAGLVPGTPGALRDRS